MEFSLFQTLHLFRGRVRLLDRHVGLLDCVSRELFGRPYAPDVRQLERRAAAVSGSRREAGAPSAFVRLEWTAAGEERLVPEGLSYYEGYALRSVQPRGVSLCCQLPLDGYPTSARTAAVEAANRLATCAGGQTGVLCDAAGGLHTVGGSPLAVVEEYTVILPPESSPCTLAPLPDGRPGRRFEAPPSVERQLLAEAVRASGLTLEERPMALGEIDRFDELFWLDHRGITALAELDGRPLMGLLAGRVAEALENLFRK